METNIIEYFIKNGYQVESINNSYRHKYAFHYHFTKSDIKFSVFQFLPNCGANKGSTEICDIGKFGSWKESFIYDMFNLDDMIKTYEENHKIISFI